MTGPAKFRAVVWLAVAAGAVVLTALGWPVTGGNSTHENASAENVPIGGPFALTSHKGERIDNARLAGRPYLVFFGFTNCPDVCPTTLYELTDLMTELGPAADRFAPLFITVDPERDTQAILAQYMTGFDRRIIALRGKSEETAAAVKAFRAYYKKVPGENGAYSMDHTASVLLIDKNGRFSGTLDMDEPRATRLAKLRKLVNA